MPSTMLLNAAYVRPIVPITQSLPLANSQTGSVFRDRGDASVAWYLPSFVAADDVDTAFGFSATQSPGDVDTQGTPLFHATLSFGLRKVMPDDARAYGAANPSMQLKEIALDGLTATLTTSSSDPQTGAATTSTYAGQIVANGTAYTVTFNALVGAGVIIAYVNLQNGGAAVNLTASYAVWREQSAQPQWVVHPIIFRGYIPAHPPADPVPGQRIPVDPVPDRPEPIPPPPAPTYTQGTASFSAPLPLAKKYASVAYATAYTVSDGTSTHAIQSVNDLKNFQTQQSEFSEFTALGDVSVKYPSFSALYIGGLSRTIVAIPAQYGIARGSTGTAAVCQALLDSSATGTDAAKFEFSFVLGPIVSAIDLVELSRDVGASSASHDCTLVLPLQLDSSRPASLSTPFESSVTYLAGSEPHTFTLSVEITDAGSSSPAVANANLFIKQLISTIEPFLVGQFGIKLDDDYPKPIDAPVVLNFSRTSGSDDLGIAVDPTSQAVDLINNSPLDLELSRYATVGDTIVVSTMTQTLAAKQSMALPGVQGGSAPAVLVDRSIALEPPQWLPATTARYLAFNVQDVQAVQYELGVIAAGVSFASRGIGAIKVQIALNDLPQITVPSFTLTPLDEAGNETISLPTQYRLTALNATVSFTVTPATGTQPPLQFTLPNDFVSAPVLALSDTNIPNFPAT